MFLFLTKLELEQHPGRWGLTSFSRTRDGEGRGVHHSISSPQSHPALPPPKQVNVRSSIEELVQALLKQARTDLEKVRVIWMWICHHIGRLRSSMEKVTLLLLVLLRCRCDSLCVLWVVSHRRRKGTLSGYIYPEIPSEVISPSLFPHSPSLHCQALQGIVQMVSVRMMAL